MVEVPVTIEQRVIAAAAPPEAIRFSIMIDSEADAPGGKSDNMSVGEKVGIGIVISIYQG